MFKFLVFTILIISLKLTQEQVLRENNPTSAISAKKTQHQHQFDAALDGLFKKINGTKFPKNDPKDQTNSRSNMRKTNEFAKIVNDIFSFSNNFASNLTVSTGVSFNLTINSTYCPYLNQKLTCNAANKYRSNNGTCNNLINPYIGSKNTPYARLLLPAYDDGINSPRTLSVSGKKLPNPRIVSLGISQPSSVQRLSKVELSHLYASFGQFLAHDIGATSASTGK